MTMGGDPPRRAKGGPSGLGSRRTARTRTLTIRRHQSAVSSGARARERGAMTGTTPTKQRQTLSGPRWLLRGICLVVAFPSAFFAAHGVLMSGQILNDSIPAGRVEAILGHAKTGPRLRLENGQEAVFPYWALYAQSVPVQLAVGDQVEKRRDSFAYVVNGMVLTDLHWVLRN